MDKQQAQELVKWFDRDHFNHVILNPQRDRIKEDPLNGYLLADCPEWFMDYLIQRHGPEVVWISRLGAAVTEDLMQDLVTLARELMRGDPQTEAAKEQTSTVEKESPVDFAAKKLSEAIAAMSVINDLPPSDQIMANAAVPKKKKTSPFISHQLVNLADIDREMPTVKKEQNAGFKYQQPRFAELSQYLEELKKSPVRQLPRARKIHLQALKSLDENFPNFGEVTEIIRQKIELSIETRSVLQTPPMLLLGPPGIGKTEYVRYLAKSLKMEFQSNAVSTTTAGFVLTGTSKSWGNGTVGVIAKRVMRLEEGKGLIMLLDEIEKAMKTNYPVLGSLLELLERRSAERFRDEFLNVEMNIRPVVSWICTANSIDAMDTALLSRLHVVEVKPPNQQHMAAVVKSIDRSVREANLGLNTCFAPLSEAAVHAVSSVEPRKMYNILDHAYVSCIRDKTRKSRGRRKKDVLPEHVRLAMHQLKNQTPEKVKMGFMK